ncbi:MAG TPA: ATP-binding protein [Candidatus Sulfotelmatobacter sp.]|jgi:signal transduction histidine kinase|nr:ATP-binding protein [Candidatus Sulfotelmatobacter sp.]
MLSASRFAAKSADTTAQAIAAADYAGESPAKGKPVVANNSSQEEDFHLSSVRVNWQLKAILPVGFVLLGGLLLFTLATVSLRDPDRHAVLIVAGAGAVTICAVSMFVLAYLVQRPMVELQEKIEQVSQGNLDVAVGFANRNDEIGDLGRNFNHMMQQLRESREEIERLHRTQMSRAEHLATLGELATGLAHEIRNPLAGIAGVIEIVGRDLPATSPARAVVKDVRREITRISRTLTDLLETARPRRPEVRLSNLNTTVEHAVMLARQQVLSRPIKIELQKSLDLPEVEHDSDQIHQVLLNLLLNAVQAMQGPGTVNVGIGSRDSFARVAVSDTGRGIPPQNLPNIFRPFYTTKGGGTGLGLSLARRIVEDHHGRIEVASAVGKGSTFTVLLPFQIPPVKIDASGLAVNR